MNLKENQNKLTDAAWDKLYKRIKQDQLLPAVEQKHRSRRAFLHTPAQRWIAVSAIVLLCIASALFIREISPKTDMLTLHNQDSATTLVTMLEDGSVVYLSQTASLNYPSHFQKNKREVTLQGDAFFEISKNKERPFLIETEVVLVEVLGTAFNIVSKNNKPFSLAVKHGEVKVTLKETGQSVYVKGGEIVLLESGNLQRSTLTSFGQFNAYTKQIHFKDERLANIIDIINMNSDNINLELSPELAERRLTVTFTDDTPLMMAELICMALNLEYKTTDNIISITQP